jgi:hypothetical protein
MRIIFFILTAPLFVGCHEIIPYKEPSDGGAMETTVTDLAPLRDHSMMDELWNPDAAVDVSQLDSAPLGDQQTLVDTAVIKDHLVAEDMLSKDMTSDLLLIDGPPAPDLNPPDLNPPDLNPPDLSSPVDSAPDLPACPPCPTGQECVFGICRLQNPGFETGTDQPGWEGAPNPPYYYTVTADPNAVHSGSYGLMFNDTGSGLPGIQQKIPVDSSYYGMKATVTAYVKVDTFPTLRLLLNADDKSGLHKGLNYVDSSATSWTKISTSLTIPTGTDHLMIILTAGTGLNADGIAYGDDFTFELSN